MPPKWPRRFCCDEDLTLIGYDGRFAADELAEWQSRGPRRTTQELIDVIRAQGVDTDQAQVRPFRLTQWIH